jgi:hypothetical protein
MEPISQPIRFNLSPLIRITLLCFYLGLTLPLPFLSQVTKSAGISASLLWLGMGVGGVALYGALSEQVVVDDHQIQVIYPAWIPAIFRRGWTLPWSEVVALKPRSTGQGGLVYYFVSQAGQGYLLPMRVAGFAQLINLVEQKTGIDTRDVRPLSQPWMYFILLGLSLLLLLFDGWTISTAIALKGR